MLLSLKPLFEQIIRVENEFYYPHPHHTSSSRCGKLLIKKALKKEEGYPALHGEQVWNWAAICAGGVEEQKCVRRNKERVREMTGYSPVIQPLLMSSQLLSKLKITKY